MGGTPPAHLLRWLLLRVLAYQAQAAALGGIDKATLRVIRQPKGETPGSPESGLFEARIPTTREGADLRAGAMLVREWKGKLERVMILEKGLAWNGKSYDSLSQIAKAMTGTSWNGHRFFGLRTASPIALRRRPAAAGSMVTTRGWMRRRRAHGNRAGRPTPLLARRREHFSRRERGRP